MAIIRNLVVKIAADISSLTSGLNSAQKKLTKVSKTFTNIGSKLTSSITLPLVALGTAAVKVSSDFEQSMANAASVAGATEEEYKEMTALAREMGSKTVFSASEAADALYYMASAGYKVDQMGASIEATLNLASATQSDLAFTTDTVISALNIFGLEASEAERVTNVYAAAIGNSMANMDKLSNSMGYVGPVANSLGYSIEDVTGALSVLYNSGYDGSTAGTALRQSLVSLMNPTSSALKVFEELGIAYDTINPATNDFASIVDVLGESGMSTAQAMEVFGARAGPGMLALLSQGGDAIRDMTDSITGTNKATEMAKIQLDTLQGQTKLLRSELEEIAISFGDVLIPMIRNFLSKYISPLTNKLMKLSSSQKQQIVNIALIAASIGPLFLVLGKVFSSLSMIIKVVKILFTSTNLIIAAIAAVVAILVYLYKTNEDFRNTVNQVWSNIKKSILNAVEAVKDWWNKNGEKIIASVKKALDILWKKVKTAFTKILKICKSVWSVVTKIIVDVVEIFKTIWTKDGAKIVAEVKRIFETLKQIFSSYFNVVKNAVVNFLSKLAPIWERIKALFMSLWDTMVELYETLKPVFDAIGVIIGVLYGVVSGVINGILAALAPFIDAIIDQMNVIIEIIRMVCAVLRGDWSDAWEHMKNAAEYMWSSIKNIFLGLWEFIKGFGQGFVDFFSGIGVDVVSLFDNIWSGIQDFFTKMWSGIDSFFSDIWNKITGFFGSVGDFFKNLWKEAFNWGKNLIQNIGDGIANAWNSVVDGVKSVGQSIKDFLGFGSPTKKGPGHTADEWIPNLLHMMEQGLYTGAPNIEKASAYVANSLNLTATNKQVVGVGTSPYGDLLNGLLQASAGVNTSGESQQDIILQVDGQTFARLMMPKLNKEYKRNGVKLKEV